MQRVYICLALAMSLFLSTTDGSLDVFDFSNLDLRDFRFFRNLPSQNPATAPYTNPVAEHFIKKKAVLEYFERLFFGSNLDGAPVKLEFHPHYGMAWQPYFERNYGRRAERLIELLGRGASQAELKYYGAIPKDFGSYH